MGATGSSSAAAKLGALAMLVSDGVCIKEFMRVALEFIKEFDLEVNAGPAMRREEEFPAEKVEGDEETRCVWLDLDDTPNSMANRVASAFSPGTSYGYLDR